ncbi:MAG: hypothetical protein KIS68_05200 [Bauldia sp.]|nr:hypothetical protein [Bauldia sp.]
MELDELFEFEFDELFEFELEELFEFELELLFELEFDELFEFEFELLLELEFDELLELELDELLPFESDLPSSLVSVAVGDAGFSASAAASDVVASSDAIARAGTLIDFAMMFSFQASRPGGCRGKAYGRAAGLFRRKRNRCPWE